MVNHDLTFTESLVIQIVDKENDFIINEIVKDVENYPDKYIIEKKIIITRDRIKDLLLKGIRYEEERKF